MVAGESCDGPFRFSGGRSEGVAENFRPVSVRSIASASSDSGSDAGVPTGEKPSPTVDGARIDTSDAKAGCSGRP